ncbi:MAG: acyl-CoA dehydrogenase [Gammaproteobacteria bacterium]|nr:acyl-CoA dehydrogenase [Gammaproteobacteria bacterium]
MPQYRVPLREIRFVLHEVLHDESHYRELGRDELNAELIDGVLEQCARFAEDVVAPTNEPGDRIGVRREADGRVVTPPGFAATYRRYVEDGWAALCGPAEFGGQGLPESFGVPAAEMTAAANMAWKLYSGLSDSAVLLLRRHASAELQQQYLPRLVSGEWLASMCLTEAHAGTDLGLMRTRAEPAGDGSFRITGTKIFITGGESDFGPNIVHLVLAKLPDAPPGSRGISLFLVPKFLPAADGSPGERNAVMCTGVEHKLGIHGSATCVMNFDGARGWLVGGPHQGLRGMFTMMNHARLWVGVQGLAQSEAAWQVALAYARERRQGRTRHGDGRSGADPIIGHPDVRRMLFTQKALVEGGRVLVYLAGLQLDKSLHHPLPAERERAAGLLAILTPVVKAFVTDRSLECTSLALQIHGGHGYVRETGVEQYFRDARITPIYEGANGVQAMDLLGRKVLGSGGVLARQLGGLIGGFCSSHARYEELAGFIPRLAGLLKEWSEATEAIAQRAARDPDEVGAASTDYLMLTGYLCLAWCWAKVAAVSVAALHNGAAEADFYRAKLATARFYYASLLPRAEAHLDALGAGAATLMELPAEHFAL